MSIVRTIVLTALLLGGIVLAPQESSASSSFGFFVGSNRYYPGYHYRPYYRPYFYRPYFGGFYNPYYYGGYGYGYGYGYPYSYYQHSYLGEIRTEVKPQQATVYVDGDYAGVADDYDGWWQRLEVAPGRHRLVFRAGGFQPYVVDVRAYPGQDVHIEYEMRPGQDQIAELEMRLPREEYSQRYERRDRYRKRAPAYEDRDRYEDRDKYQDRDEYQDQNKYQDHRDKQFENKSYDQNRESNRQTLRLRVDPSDATVYIDGNYYGTANDNGRAEIEILLPEGVHRIEVVRPGHTSFSQDVNVSRNGENLVTIKLQKK